MLKFSNQWLLLIVACLVLRLYQGWVGVPISITYPQLIFLALMFIASLIREGQRTKYYTAQENSNESI